MLALIISVLLTIIVLEFVYSSSIDLRQAKRARDDAQVSYAVDSGLMLAETLLRIDKMRGSDVPLDTLDDVWATAEMPTSVGSMTIKVTIVDEASKLNLLNLIYPNAAWRQQWREAFIRLCEDVRQREDGEDYEQIAEEIADYMASVKEADDLATDQDFSWSGPPLLSLDEIANLEGITPEFLYGTADPDEPDVASVGGMWEYLTIFSHGRINLNTATQQVVQSLHASITTQMAAEIVSRRGEVDETTERKKIYRSKDDLRDIEGINDPIDGEDDASDTVYRAISDKVTTRSSYFLVTVEVDVGEGVRRTFRAYYKRYNTDLYRLSVEEASPERTPLPPRGVEVGNLPTPGF